MKKLVLIMAITLMASSAMAVFDETPNSIGFYWDTEAEIVDGYEGFYTPFKEAYIIITNPTFVTFKALEMSIKAECDDLTLPFTGIYANVPAEFGDHIILEALPDLVYATNTPIAVNGPLLQVMTILFTITGVGLHDCYLADQVGLFINPIDDATLPGACIVMPADGADYIHLVPVAPYGQPVAMMNYEVCATENASFGSVKSLYR